MTDRRQAGGGAGSSSGPSNVPEIPEGVSTEVSRRTTWEKPDPCPLGLAPRLSFPSPCARFATWWILSQDLVESIKAEKRLESQGINEELEVSRLVRKGLSVAQARAQVRQLIQYSQATAVSAGP